MEVFGWGGILRLVVKSEYNLNRKKKAISANIDPA